MFCIGEDFLPLAHGERVRVRLFARLASELLPAARVCNAQAVLGTDPLDSDFLLYNEERAKLGQREHCLCLCAHVIQCATGLT